MNKESEFEKISRKNVKFFNDNLNYRQNINNIDTYHNIRDEVSRILSGTENLLDIGHGGVFDYDTSKIQKIVGLDLDKMIDTKYLPKNITLENGSALEIPHHLRDFDTILFAMLIHHLIGKNVKENLLNLNKCIEQSKKALIDGGKLLIVESCVPYWFYLIEKLLFKPTSYVINKYLNHPPAFQYTIKIIEEVLKKNNFKEIKIKKIKQGRFILQYGIKFPTFLTPVETYIITALK